MELRDRMKSYQVPGVSIAVIHRGSIAWTRGYGLARQGTSQGVTPATLFQAASISKPLTALAVLRLAAAGRVDLDADVNSVLTSWRIPDNEFTAIEKVTLRRLLSHSAGMADWTVGGGWQPGHPLPSLPDLLEGAAPTPSSRGAVPARVVLPVNSRWRYSNYGYAVIQLLLEEATGVPFAAHMLESVLRPLGMERSTFAQPLPRVRWREAAVAHNRNGEPLAGDWRVYPAAAPSGLWTTPTELARAALEIHRAWLGRSTFLSQALARAMLTPQMENAGLGVNLRGEGRSLTFAHGGSNAGFRAYLVAFAERGDGAVIMTNGAGGDELINEILRGIAKEYDWPANGTTQFQHREVVLAPVDSTLFARIPGRYEFERFPGTFLTISQESGRLFGQIGSTPARYELLPQRQMAFVMRNGWNLTFEADSAGRPVAIRLDNGRAIRVP
jgi:CubicO group peptidase (beta-lactamase class C family)